MLNQLGHRTTSGALFVLNFWIGEGSQRSCLQLHFSDRHFLFLVACAPHVPYVPRFYYILSEYFVQYEHIVVHFIGQYICSVRLIGLGWHFWFCFWCHVCCCFHFFRFFWLCDSHINAPCFCS